MSQAQGIKTIASLTEELNQISKRLEGNPSALPIELDPRVANFSLVPRWLHLG